MLITSLTFANTIEKDDLVNKNHFSNETIELEEDVVACHMTSTYITYRAVTKRVFTMYQDEVAYETTFVIDSICTTCYSLSVGSPTSSTTCVYY